jgi:heme exporter protein A
MENNSLSLHLVNLSCTRGGRPIFSGLGFELQSGEALLIKGANGAGKTSLLYLLAGLLPLEQGSLTFTNGLPLSEDMHFAGVRDGIKTLLTVQENLAFWRDMLDGDGIERALAFWNLQNLKEMPARFLSSGQRRRLALCRLLLKKRKVWLLDEPFAALDAQNQTLLAELLTHHLEDGGMAIIATHGPLALKNSKQLLLDKAPAKACAP